jgi:hypothetical protein
MTQYTTLALLPETDYGVPSGNYDGVSTSFVGNAIPAANYYGGQGYIQTLNFDVANLLGIITTQATLSDSAESADWFDIASYGDAANVTTGANSVSILGNFSWLQVKVTEFTAGNISVATASY